MRRMDLICPNCNSDEIEEVSKRLLFCWICRKEFYSKNDLAEKTEKKEEK